MSDAREVVLERVRSAIRGASAPTIGRSYRRTGILDAAARVDRFCERVADYRAEVHRVPPTAVADTVAKACAAAGASRIVIPPRLPHEWRPETLELVPGDALTPHELNKLDGVLTGSTVAIAESGTIALTAGPHEGHRALTLVPDLHLCVVRTEDIVELLPEALERLGPLVANERRPVTLISGPSATSDIELRRVEGVHGPRRLIVLVLASERRSCDHVGSAGARLGG